MNTLAKHFSLGGLLRFAAPAVGMMLVLSIYTVTDGIFIGRYAGTLALAASNIVYPVLNLLFGLSIMLSSGGSALVAKTLGEGDAALARRRFTLIVVVGAVLHVDCCCRCGARHIARAQRIPLHGADFGASRRFTRALC